jgi:hypothetical protein
MARASVTNGSVVKLGDHQRVSRRHTVGVKHQGPPGEWAARAGGSGGRDVFPQQIRLTECRNPPGPGASAGSPRGISLQKAVPGVA